MPAANEWPNCCARTADGATLDGMSDFPHNMQSASPPPPKPPGPITGIPQSEDRPATRGDIQAVVAELQAIRELLSRLADKQ